jgi:hypothetical protein
MEPFLSDLDVVLRDSPKERRLTAFGMKKGLHVFDRD